jgi:hypothetical protein
MNKAELEIGACCRELQDPGRSTVQIGMLYVRQGLGEKVRDVDIAGDVLHVELPPLDAVLQPVKAHVNAF